ncbi:bifunctional DNA primase/polymerase [Janibacter indicus]
MSTAPQYGAAPDADNVEGRSTTRIHQTNSENDSQTTAVDRLPVLLDLHDRGAFLHELHRTGPDGTCHCPRGRNCTGSGKHPLHTAWQHGPGLSRADLTLLESEGAMFGVRTGEMRGRDEVLFVVDIDGPPGEASWAQLVEQHGALPETYTVATPSAGRHLYFVAPAGTRIGNSAGAIAPKVDVRGHGGQVVAPGTRIRNYRGTGQVGVYTCTSAARFAEGDL